MTDAFSAMEYPHWLMITGAVPAVLGFVGLAFRRNGSAEADRAPDGSEGKFGNELGLRAKRPSDLLKNNSPPWGKCARMRAWPNSAARAKEDEATVPRVSCHCRIFNCRACAKLPRTAPGKNQDGLYREHPDRCRQACAVQGGRRTNGPQRRQNRWPAGVRPSLHAAGMK
jgi:hypothetical protein